MNKISGLFASMVLLAFTVPVFAQNGLAVSKRGVDLICMQTAVKKRDTAIMTAFSVFSNSIQLALSTRLTELKTAWGIQDASARKQAIKSAWEKYKKTAKSARETMQVARKNAWNQFKADRKACGTGAAKEDTTPPTVDNNL